MISSQSETTHRNTPKENSVRFHVPQWRLVSLRHLKTYKTICFPVFEHFRCPHISYIQSSILTNLILHFSFVQFCFAHYKKSCAEYTRKKINNWNEFWSYFIPIVSKHQSKYWKNIFLQILEISIKQNPFSGHTPNGRS